LHQRAVLLEPQYSPGQLDYAGAQPGQACSGEPLLAAFRPNFLLRNRITA
jgi:hypothetical protein